MHTCTHMHTHTHTHTLTRTHTQTAASWNQVNVDIVSSRKFKWLRHRASQHTQLLAQIKNFVLTDEVDVRALLPTLRKQVSLLWVVWQVNPLV